MALAVYKSGFKKSMPPEPAYKLWKALHNSQGMKPADRAKLDQIQYVYLDWTTAPEAYVRENLRTIIPMALNDWFVDRKGKPTKPGTPEAWAFAKKYGLWSRGPTDLVLGHHALFTQAAFAGSLPVNDR